MTSKYGFITLSELVDEYAIFTSDDIRKNYIRMLNLAKWSYKELFWKVFKITKNKRIVVDRRTMTAVIPPDCLRLFSVRLLDEGYGCCNPAPHVLPQTPSCDCKACNCTGELCGAINNISVVTEDVLLDGDIYQRTIKTRVLGNGDIIQEILQPYGTKDDQGDTIIQYVPEEKYIASLSVKPCGCVDDTPANREVINHYCGCPVYCCRPSQVPRLRESCGDYKVDLDAHLIHILHSQATYVEISYIGNGEECAQEILVPEYAVRTMIALMYADSIEMNMKISGGEKERAAKKAEVSKLKLFQFMNPVVERDFRALQSIIYQWG